MCPNPVDIWSVGKRAHRKEAEKEEGNLIKMKQQPWPSLQVCRVAAFARAKTVAQTHRLEAFYCQSDCGYMCFFYTVCGKLADKESKGCEV